MANHRIYDEPTRRVIVVLPERLRQVAIRLGQGNLRAGIALALERAEKQKQEGEGK